MQRIPLLCIFLRLSKVKITLHKHLAGDQGSCLGEIRAPLDARLSMANKIPQAIEKINLIYKKYIVSHLTITI